MGASTFRNRIVTIVAVLFVLTLSALFGIGFIAVRAIREVVTHNQRFNRLVLMRTLVNEFRGANPTRQFPDSERNHSWRLKLIEALYAECPNILQRYPGLAGVRPPFNSSSPMPSCFGTGHVMIFRVLPEVGEMKGVDDDQTVSPKSISDAAILIEADLGPASWTSSVDLVYSEDQAWLKGENGGQDHISDFRDFYLLRASGDISWHKGPVSVTRFIAIIRGDEGQVVP